MEILDSSNFPYCLFFQDRVRCTNQFIMRPKSLFMKKLFSIKVVGIEEDDEIGRLNFSAICYTTYFVLKVAVFDS